MQIGINKYLLQRFILWNEIEKSMYVNMFISGEMALQDYLYNEPTAANIQLPCQFIQARFCQNKESVMIINDIATIQNEIFEITSKQAVKGTINELLGYLPLDYAINLKSKIYKKIKLC